MESWKKVQTTLPWLPQYLWQRLSRRRKARGVVHLIMGVADHFEPSIMPSAGAAFVGRDEQERRLELWCAEYPKAMEAFRDAEGRPFCHTYFYPAEQYDKDLIARLAEHCHAGWGEIEIHLHHGLNGPDTPENTKQTLTEFRDALASCGCLAQLDGIGPVRYAFVHGNWSLANSAGGLFCGVDNEMKILAETGCYADFTLPAAPHPAQVAKINSLYECLLPLDQRAPQRRGRDLRCGMAPDVFPLIIQGPLMLNFRNRSQYRLIPRIENGEITGNNVASIARLQLWRKASIAVKGRPDWLFIKLHCHGMDPRDREALLGEPMRRFLRDLLEEGKRGNGYQVHFVTAREMFNIILAACDGREGNPGDYRSYRLRLIEQPPNMEVNLRFGNECASCTN